MRTDEERVALFLDGRLPPQERAAFVAEVTGSRTDERLLDVLADGAATARDVESQEALGEAPASESATQQPRRLRRLHRKSEKRWCVPPAIQQPHGESLQGMQVLEEHADHELAFLLWISLRDVLLWASLEPEQRALLFDPKAARSRVGLITGADVPPEPGIALLSMAALVEHPEQANSQLIGLVCSDISRWARDRGATGTAVAFSQAAAACAAAQAAVTGLPEDAAPALSVGALLLQDSTADQHALTRAATWLMRTIGLARRSGDWMSYSQAYVKLGALYTRLGRPNAAVRNFVQGAKAAKRNSYSEIHASALHGLMRLAMEAGDLEAAAIYGQGALRKYGKTHAATPDVLADYACLLVLRGDHARSVPMLRSQLLRPTLPPQERVLTLALLARASAGIEDRAEYQEHWSAAWSLINLPGAEGENHATALLHLAIAASALRDWPRVDQAIAAQAKETRHRDARVRAQLEELAVFGGASPQTSGWS